jgi:integrase
MIDAAAVGRYIEKRKAHGSANGTINRELGVLTRMFRLGLENGRVIKVPVIRKLKEAAPRQGFFEREQFEAVRKHLPVDLQAAATVAYTFGWRTQSEVLTLERRQLDLDAETLRLDPGTTKNDDGRLVYLTPELKTLLRAQTERVNALERQLGRIIPWLFPHLPARHISRRLVGSQREDFRKAWVTACKRAGVPGALRHDCRRTAVRNMVNRGVPERVAMKVTGHRTRSVFDRYHIVSPADLKEAARKLAQSAW